MDMLQGGMSWEEVVTLGKAVVAAGVNIVSTHFCWHEAFVPTIATMVPRAAFTRVTGRLRRELGVPMITSNRINMPQVAEDVLARGDGDIVSMARPMLADPELVRLAGVHADRVSINVELPTVGGLRRLARLFAAAQIADHVGQIIDALAREAAQIGFHKDFGRCRRVLARTAGGGQKVGGEAPQGCGIERARRTFGHIPQPFR